MGSLRRRVAQTLPEDTLRRILRVAHGETPVQKRVLDVARPSRPGRTVDTFDASVVRSETVALVAAALDRGRVPYVLVPGPHGSVESIAVSRAHADATRLALVAGLTDPEWLADPHCEDTLRLPRHDVPLERSAAIGPAGTRLHRRLTSIHGDRLAGPDLGIDLDFWKPVTKSTVRRADGGTHQVGTMVAPRPGLPVAYLTGERWREATAAPNHWIRPEQSPQLLEVTEPVDVVYTWVDGSDPHWIERKKAYADDTVLAELNSTANHAARFHSRDELRYSLRSLGMYASWVRHVYIVTDSQMPPWLDLSNPRVTLVDHKEIFDDPSVLPVYNSHAIESQLHHIDGLAEHYLYLNDDMFFGRPVTPEAFFASNRIARFFLSQAVLDLEPPDRRDLPVMSAAKRNRSLLESEFGATVTQKFRHTPYPQLRSVIEQMETDHKDLFAEVARSRFRHPNDYSIPAALSHYYAYALGRSIPADISYFYQDIGRPEFQRWIDNMLRSRKAEVFCLNDTETDPATVAQLSGLISDFLERYFPIRSEFELPGF